MGSENILLNPKSAIFKFPELNLFGNKNKYQVDLLICLMALSLCVKFYLNDNIQHHKEVETCKT